MWLSVVAPVIMMVCGCGSDEDSAQPPGEPRAVQEILQDYDDDPIPVFYVRSDNDELVPLDQDQGNIAVYDGVVCFKALTCTNPSCPKAGQENVFSQKVPGYSVDPNGGLVYPLEGPKLGPAQCPHCKSYDVEPYLPPDLKEKANSRKAEMVRSRAEEGKTKQ